MNAKKCRYCDTYMPSTFRSCPYCGRRQPMSIGFLILLIAIISAAAGAYLLLGHAGDKREIQEAPVVENTEPAEGTVEKGVQSGKQPDEEVNIQQSMDAGKKAEEERLAREKAANEKRLREEAARIKAERERFEREQAEKRRRAEEEALKKKAAEEKILQESSPVGEEAGTASAGEENSAVKEEKVEEKPAVSVQPAGPEPGSSTTEQ